MVKEFIEGWDLIQVLGEGTFGEVKLLVNKANGEACAMKEIDLEQNPDAEDSVKKEICVHKLLKHKQIGIKQNVKPLYVKFQSSLYPCSSVLWK